MSLMKTIIIDNAFKFNKKYWRNSVFVNLNCKFTYT